MLEFYVIYTLSLTRLEYSEFDYKYVCLSLDFIPSYVALMLPISALSFPLEDCPLTFLVRSV